jgi:phage repressor protein C with HTH and peptisase S24 domain
MKFMPLGLYRVRGESMLPTFKPGAILVGAHWRLIKPKIGMPVVIKKDRALVKRIKKIDSNGIWVEGDNKVASTDSRTFGYIKPKEIEAIIFMRLI